MENLSTIETIFLFIAMTIYLSIGASVLYSTQISRNISKFLLLTTDDPLDSSEQERLDNLLTSGKRYHNLALLFSGISITIASLENFQVYTVPFGNLAIPRLQTAIGLYLLVILMLAATDRFFLMAYPWLRLDRRRPPFDWLVMGLNIKKKYNLGIWTYLPLLVSSLSVTITLSDIVPKGVGFMSYVVCGWGLIYLPRTVDYWRYLINEKLDHRGGPATYSIYLLYHYRLIRQYVFTILITYPVIELVPHWKFPEKANFFTYLFVFVVILFFVRIIAGIPKVYRWIDKFGVKRGFPMTSHHYK